MEGNMEHLSDITTGGGCKNTKEVKTKVDNWKRRFDENQTTLDDRKKEYMPLVNEFYDLVTAFYEFGWGQSFHFAPRKEWESFEASIYRHEYFLAHKLQLEKGKKVLDIGCGVGGPARNIATFCEATIVGINNNSYQIERCNKLVKDGGVAHLVTFKQADFMKLDELPNDFDAAYSIEATCHAPDKEGLYSGIYKKLKPGALYGTYEWLMTDQYDPDDESHTKIKKGIEIGNGIAELVTEPEVRAALKKAGFEIVYSEDLAARADKNTPWFESLSGSFSLSGWKHTKIGRFCTNKIVSVLETVKIAPKGTTEVSNLLMSTAEDLVKGGETEIFTPVWFILCRKPENEED